MAAARSLLLLLASLCAAAASMEIRGKVGLSVDGFTVVPLRPGSVTEVTLSGPDGEAARTFADREGWFTLRDVSPGSYVVTTTNPAFVYPDVAIDVTAKAGLARAAFVFNKQQIMTSALFIRPALQAQYYELRKPVDVWSFIKSPYGLMIGFMLFGIFVFPMLKVDPEEYREAMASLRGGEGEQAPAAQQQRIRDR
ncbi:ER membrane protein complex subunit 7 [Scenedesmus sp. PABB004]|nr:ER membrane protein complex subunit 7 [Scenedesmus sp. PABB004]